MYKKINDMKKGTIIALSIAAVVLGGFLWVKSTYNSLVKSDEGVSAAWAQVENVYQRRADLIPNLVSTVKGYAQHEQNTLQEVVAARAKATQITIDPTDLSEKAIQQYQTAQGQLSQALGKLLMIQEQYPDLKANQNFLELQAQLEGTENRIATERMKFNETAQKYNTMVRSFPKNIIASMFGFEKKGYFQSKEGADTAPVVEF
jgi:LemA protein